MYIRPLLNAWLRLMNFISFSSSMADDELSKQSDFASSFLLAFFM